jgi:hypothetical protein
MALHQTGHDAARPFECLRIGHGLGSDRVGRAAERGDAAERGAGSDQPQDHLMTLWGELSELHCPTLSTKNAFA